MKESSIILSAKKSGLATAFAILASLLAIFLAAPNKAGAASLAANWISDTKISADGRVFSRDPKDWDPAKKFEKSSDKIWYDYNKEDVYYEVGSKDPCPAWIGVNGPFYTGDAYLQSAGLVGSGKNGDPIRCQPGDDKKINLSIASYLTANLGRCTEGRWDGTNRLICTKVSGKLPTGAKQWDFTDVDKKGGSSVLESSYYNASGCKDRIVDVARDILVVHFQVVVGYRSQNTLLSGGSKKECYDQLKETDVKLASKRPAQDSSYDWVNKCEIRNAGGTEYKADNCNSIDTNNTDTVIKYKNTSGGICPEFIEAKLGNAKGILNKPKAVGGTCTYEEKIVIDIAQVDKAFQSTDVNIPDACSRAADPQACVQQACQNGDQAVCSGTYETDTPDHEVTELACTQGEQCIWDVVNLAVNFLSAGVGLVVTIMIVIGGIQYTMSGDNPNATAAAKKRVFNAVFALIVFIFLWAFINWLLPEGII